MKSETGILKEGRGMVRGVHLSRKRRKSVESFLWGGGVIFLVLAVWEICSNTGVINPMFSSSPSRIARTGLALIRDGSLWVHIKASGTIFILGYLMAIAAGIPLGVLMGWFKKAGLAFGPLVAACYTTPRIALMPLFIIWFGLGMGSKLALVFLSAVFPLIINMQTAVSNLDKDLVKVAAAYGATQRQVFFTIALPESIPYLMMGLRLATGRALLGIVGAEVFGGSEGLGYLIQYAGATFQTDKVFVCVLVIAAAGIFMDRGLYRLNKRFDGWRSRED
ncbi:NitT/TauT family transport system permease protein [Paenibacillus forsythiae]|uniref:NitT/TauT family transport system permease protein n=1 Tax=Paenibacillus forsythiae TaxID=365616 RepID=A0ABU3H4H9_9BACL|nr:ABC transporter permease [Paenibacillus forsythiae]MDT3425356.1 NitT/TauT family transport system permease protein [Paenibacillus forsythiae]